MGGQVLYERWGGWGGRWSVVAVRRVWVMVGVRVAAACKGEGCSQGGLAVAKRL